MADEYGWFDDFECLFVLNCTTDPDHDVWNLPDALEGEVYYQNELGEEGITIADKCRTSINCYTKLKHQCIQIIDARRIYFKHPKLLRIF